MSCKDCEKKNCGCADSAKSMPNSFINDPTVCSENSEKCVEIFDMECICYGGEDIIELNIKKGDRLNEILQKIVGAISNPSCMSSIDETVCQSPLNITILNITSNSLIINWELVSSAVSYTVEFKEATSITWNILPTVNALTNQDTIVGLAPDTVYDVRVYATCNNNGCYSLTYRIKTNIQ